MRFKKETPQEQFDRLNNWHSCFAWFPTYVNDQVVWLERLERKANPISWDGYGGMVWEYRFPLTNPFVQG